MTATSSLRVVSVDGQPLMNPTGSFTPADIQITSNVNVQVIVEARNIPRQSGNPAAPTIVKLHLVSDNAPDQIVDSTPLTGTDQQATATVNVTFPPGFSRGSVRATWSTQ